MRSVLTISASLLFGLALSSVAHANDHKILGVIAMPRNETNDLTLKIPVCRIVKRIQLTATSNLAAHPSILKLRVAPAKA